MPSSKKKKLIDTVAQLQKRIRALRMERAKHTSELVDISLELLHLKDELKK